MTAPERRVPAVHAVLSHPALAGRPGAAGAVRRHLGELRARLAADLDATVDVGAIASAVAAELAADSTRGRLRPVINATGVLLHTNLGRAPYSDEAIAAVTSVLRGYCDLELDLATGTRASRQRLVRGRIAELCGAEAATAVNNCAAATVLALRAVALGKEVIVSRGQLVEIGGSYRLPEIMAASGCVLREVGTTNRTRAADYAAAVSPNTGAILRVHTSNFRVRGFTESASLAELAAVARAAGVPLIDDAGSGATCDLAGAGLGDEPDITKSVPGGADLVLFSGDKLFGGPQAGLIAGRRDLIERVECDPLARAVRLDKLGLAALGATLELHLSGRSVPVLSMLRKTAAELRPAAEALAAKLAAAGVPAAVRDSAVYAGGGAGPDDLIASVAVTLEVDDPGADELAARLRTGPVAVLPRVHKGRVWLELRAVFDWQIEELARAVVAAASPSERGA